MEISAEKSRLRFPQYKWHRHIKKKERIMLKRGQHVLVPEAENVNDQSKCSLTGCVLIKSTLQLIAWKGK